MKIAQITFHQISSKMWSLSALLFALAVAMAPLAGFAAGKQERIKPIRKPSYDPEAERVGLFEGLEEEKLSYKMIMKDRSAGTLLVKNDTDEPITVDLPPGLVGVHVIGQFDDAGGGGFGNDAGGGGGGGQQQAVGGGGGGFGGGGFGGGGFGGGGQGGFFSIPPEKVVAVPLQTVCLEYGKGEPSPKSRYQLVRVEEYTDDKELQAFLNLYGSRKANSHAAQAAAWVLTDGLTWREAVNKRKGTVGGSAGTPFFSRADLQTAWNMISVSKSVAAQDKEDGPAKTEPRTRRSIR